MNAWQSFVFYASMASMPVGASLFRVHIRQDNVQLGYDLSAEERRRDVLRAEQQELEVELAAATSPGRLSQLAARLGLRPPKSHQLIRGEPVGADSESEDHNLLDALPHDDSLDVKAFGTKP